MKKLFLFTCLTWLSVSSFCQIKPFRFAFISDTHIGSPKDSIIFCERKPGAETLPSWAAIKIENRNYDVSKKYHRPDFSINQAYSFVKEKWKFSSEANVISTPAVDNDIVIFGNQNGKIVALSLNDGKQKWNYKSQGPIFSSPAISSKKIVLGSADGFVYCLNADGKPIWKLKTNAAVLGSPLIQNDTVIIGGSDHSFRAIDLKNGKEIWNFNGLNGPVVSKPLFYEGKIIFGAWDKNLYALNETDGKLLWTWNNGSSVINYSPASCVPVAWDGVVYVVAPDRYISAIDANTGKTLWRNNEATIRESIGISTGGKFIYGKTMQDTIVAYSTSREAQHPVWKMNCSFGYEHVPSMLIEKEGRVFFGTRNGVVYCIDPAQKKIIWAHKIDNSMVNTVNVLDKDHLIVSTMDGKVVLLETKVTRVQ